MKYFSIRINLLQILEYNPFSLNHEIPHPTVRKEEFISLLIFILFSLGVCLTTSRRFFFLCSVALLFKIKEFDKLSVPLGRFSIISLLF